jgi:hypothetical protein
MQKLAAIHQFIAGLNLVAVENIDSWPENVRFQGVATNKGTGLVLFRQEYDAVISIERFPHTRHPAELLFGQVVAWLIDQDEERENQGVDQPSVTVDVLDDGTADLDITIPFIEDVRAVEDEAGQITLNGKTYALAGFEIDYAETGDIGEVNTDGQ